MLATAIAIALSVWGPAPCTVAYHAADVPDPALGWTIRHDPTYCEVLLERRPWLWWELCAVVVHETGHAHGLGHSTDPLNVMFPRLIRRADACIGKRPAQYKRGAVIEL